MKNQVGGQNNSNEKNFFFFLLIFSFNVNSASILDYETEIFVKKILNTIIKTNKFENKILFTIVLDDNPNAYVDQDNIIYISTGLLKYSASYEAFLGVLAHEVGHLHLHHVSKRKNSANKLINLNKITNLSIIAGSLISNKNDYLMQSLLTNKIGIQNYFQAFSRDQEREADFYAIETLNRLNLSSKPLLEFLGFLERKSIQKGFKNEYYKFSTHPIYKERYEIINQEKIDNNFSFDEKINQEFNFIKAKLFGFTEDNNDKLKKYLIDEYLLYAKSIILSKKGNLKDSMIILNNLLEKKTNYLFMLEVKADILYSNGFLKEANLFYQKIIKLIPENHYINKRIFEIYISSIDNKNKVANIRFFNQHSHLMEIFENNLDLKNKFKLLANNNKQYEWVDFFLFEEKFNNNNINKKKFITIMNKIKDNSNDPVLKRLIKKQINKIDKDV